jgi:Cas7 group CRISPR-associated protein Csh2
MTNYTKKDQESMVQKRQQGIVWVEVNMSNPNGNGNDGRPRQLPDGKGTIHPVCFKAKIRSAIHDRDSIVFKTLAYRVGIEEKDFDNYRIVESKHRGFGQDVDATNAAKQLLKLSDDDVKKHYWDHRMFGSTILENNPDKEKSGEKRRILRTGCVTLTHLVSVAPIHIVDDQIAKRFPMDGKLLEKGNGTFGSTSVVEHGLYIGTYTYNPLFAEGVSEKDLELFKALVLDAFGISQSSSRSAASVVKVLHITHNDCIGNERQFNAFCNAVKPTVKSGVTIPASLDDYDFPSVKDASTVFTTASVEELA